MAALPSPIRMRILDPHPHWSEKLDPVSNMKQNSEALEAHNRAVKGLETQNEGLEDTKISCRRFPSL
jgi:hypothetical protein